MYVDIYVTAVTSSLSLSVTHQIKTEKRYEDDGDTDPPSGAYIWSLGSSSSSVLTMMKLELSERIESESANFGFRDLQAPHQDLWIKSIMGRSWDLAICRPDSMSAK